MQGFETVAGVKRVPRHAIAPSGAQVNTARNPQPCPIGQWHPRLDVKTLNGRVVCKVRPESRGVYAFQARFAVCGYACSHSGIATSKNCQHLRRSG